MGQEVSVQVALPRDVDVDDAPEHRDVREGLPGGGHDVPDGEDWAPGVRLAVAAVAEVGGVLADQDVGPR